MVTKLRHSLFSWSTKLSMVSAAITLAVTSPTLEAQEADRGSSVEQSLAIARAAELERCVSARQAELSRYVRMLADAETRARSSDATIARDAATSIESLLERVDEAREGLSSCLASRPTPARAAAPPPATAPPTATEQAVSQAGGTVHEVEGASTLTTHVHVVRGEKIDGAGRVPDAAVQASVHAIGSRLEQCYGGYVDRAASRRGEVHVSFALVDRRSASEVTIERAGGFDSTMQRCVRDAFASVSAASATGRSVFSYALRFE